MKVKSPQQGGRGMGDRENAGGHLPEGVDPAVGPTGSGNGKGFSVDSFQGVFEGELDGGMGILPLPSEKVGSSISHGQLKGLKLKRSQGF